MRIGGITNAYPTYVYNPNTVSAGSINKLSKISDDVLDKKIDYSETTAQENQNPLKRGETIDFEGILAKQMQQGQNRAAKIMPNGLAPAEDKGKTEEAAALKVNDETEAAAGVSVNAETGAGGNANVTQMQRAIQAYEMFMSA